MFKPRRRPSTYHSSSYSRALDFGASLAHVSDIVARALSDFGSSVGCLLQHITRVGCPPSQRVRNSAPPPPCVVSRLRPTPGYNALRYGALTHARPTVCNPRSASRTRYPTWVRVLTLPHHRCVCRCRYVFTILWLLQQFQLSRWRGLNPHLPVLRVRAVGLGKLKLLRWLSHVKNMGVPTRRRFELTRVCLFNVCGNVHCRSQGLPGGRGSS